MDEVVDELVKIATLDSETHNECGLRMKEIEMGVRRNRHGKYYVFIRTRLRSDGENLHVIENTRELHSHCRLE